MVIKQSQTVSLWDTTAIPPLLTGVRIAEGSAEYDEFASQSMSAITPTKEHCGIGLPIFQPSAATESQCSHCQITFSDRKEQVNHYRLDWHRCNLQRSLAGKSPLTEEQFLQEMSDVSSLSGSDEEEDEEEEEDVSTAVLRKQARMFFCNIDGNVISIFRTILFGKREEMCGEQDVLHRLQAAPRKMNVAVILLGGGHFAAAVFRGNEVVIHKTFHNYTVRAKQGGSQSSKDGQSGTSHPKSSGASLRRYNELSQQQHVQELMESWKSHLSKCNLIFYRAKNQDRKTLFSGKSPVLRAQDDRLRSIPFPTKRAKFSEVKRVYELLSSVVVHGTEDEFRKMIRESRIGEVKPAVKKKESSPKKEKKTKSERKEIPKAVQSSSESDVDGSESMTFEMSQMTFGMQDIGGGKDCSFDRKTLKKLESRERRNQPKKDVVKTRNRETVWNEIYTACRTGKKERLQVALKVSSPSEQQGNSHGKAFLNALEHTQIPSDFTNITFGKKERTMLHVAAESGHRDLVWWLLENGCDPGAVDDKGTLPINVSKDKDTRNMFRRFMSDYPDKYDYKEAGVPGPLTAEQEAKEKERDIKKKKAQIRRKEAEEREKREKEEAAMKEKKERAEEARREREEKQRFLKLSDREKRALAAERRFLQMQSTSEEPKITKQRCFMCGADITGIVPFEYNDYRFCTTKCVREHRTKKP